MRYWERYVFYCQHLGGLLSLYGAHTNGLLIHHQQDSLSNIFPTLVGTEMNGFSNDGALSMASRHVGFLVVHWRERPKDSFCSSERVQCGCWWACCTLQHAQFCFHFLFNALSVSAIRAAGRSIDDTNFTCWRWKRWGGHIVGGIWNVGLFGRAGKPQVKKASTNFVIPSLALYKISLMVIKRAGVWKRSVGPSVFESQCTDWVASCCHGQSGRVSAWLGRARDEGSVAEPKWSSVDCLFLSEKRSSEGWLLRMHVRKGRSGESESNKTGDCDVPQHPQRLVRAPAPATSPCVSERELR